MTWPNHLNQVLKEEINMYTDIEWPSAMQGLQLRKWVVMLAFTPSLTVSTEKNQGRCRGKRRRIDSLLWHVMSSALCVAATWWKPEFGLESLVIFFVGEDDAGYKNWWPLGLARVRQANQQPRRPLVIKCNQTIFFFFSFSFFQ